MVEVVFLRETNTKKRLVKALKVYIADSGIAACLLGPRSYREMRGHPPPGAVWEQILLTNIRGLYPKLIFLFAAGSNTQEPACPGEL
jgi:predicted AAA+ superfamily ATPase